ncbi:hypothetical protein [Nitratireductor indicus]|uniref:hypothetical protein n=1 Tax=Nitratireductor indicus TaxID=721133 RepID=UPI0008EB9164|nr:hypothetical protein [Nitratireductor indicus]SFQ33705.1 HNH endonuclease [Nitratireductor indicus]
MTSEPNTNSLERGGASASSAIYQEERQIQGQPVGGSASLASKSGKSTVTQDRPASSVQRRAHWGEAADYFYRVVLNYEGDDCLIWPFQREQKGYAVFAYKRRSTLAGNIVCNNVFGPPPTDRHQAAHSCGNGSGGCVNPKHLRWATPEENEADKKIHGTVVRGEAVKNSKLTVSDVRAIRSLRATHTARDLAEKFGVSRVNIWRVLNGSRWGWVK